MQCTMYDILCRISIQSLITCITCKIYGAPILLLFYLKQNICYTIVNMGVTYNM